jgi:hypothetical protein
MHCSSAVLIEFTVNVAKTQTNQCTGVRHGLE